MYFSYSVNRSYDLVNLAPSVIFAFMALLFILLYAGVLLRQRSFKNNGVLISAELKDKIAVFRGKGGYAYKFYVSYRYDGIEYNKWIRGTVEDYGKYVPGERIDIYCMPDNPGKCTAESYLSPRAARVYIVVAVIFLVMAIVFYALLRYAMAS